MTRSSPWQSYRQIATRTATPGHLVLMLFDGALRFLELARLGFREEDPSAFNQTIHNNVQRAQAIIHELNAALNLQDGGELAVTLRNLYNYFDRRLQEANLHKKEEPILEIIARITTLREAWSEMLQNQSHSTVSDPTNAALLA